MAERKGRLQIDLLGTSFALAADQPAEYLQAIYNHYKKVVSEVQQTSGVNDSLRVAIIAGILLSDELSKERLNPQGTLPQDETEVLIEQSARKMIEDIDSIIYSLAPSNDAQA
ncbi:cell division protein ZapA [Treponema vincentii]|uniref:cell division protein ZapA n=1 Tax=Treponema TaxID=157 RepID=UPI001BAFACD1|nr:cell division protein ZapA [Treponema vincentii]QUY17275.1 cell division protein ZapA [Treponema vincentii]